LYVKVYNLLFVHLLVLYRQLGYKNIVCQKYWVHKKQPSFHIFVNT